jgi:site-specific recombinase XerD
MLEELERRNYAPSTIRAYIRTVEHYSRHFHRPPAQLGLDDIREYQAAMFRSWKLAPNTVTQRLAALRFLYIQVLKRGWSAAETPYPKKVLHLPEILSQQEAARLIDATETPFQRILVMTLYATGARRAEVARLKVTDIDSRRMVMHIRGGKGRKDRAASSACSTHGTRGCRIIRMSIASSRQEVWERITPLGSRHAAPSSFR